MQTARFFLFLINCRSSFTLSLSFFFFSFLFPFSKGKGTASLWIAAYSPLKKTETREERGNIYKKKKK